MIKPVKWTAIICTCVIVALIGVTVILFVYGFLSKTVFGGDDDWETSMTAQSSIGAITVTKPNFYDVYYNSYIEINGDRVYRIYYRELIDGSRYYEYEYDNYFRFEYNGQRYMLLFGDVCALYYSADLNTYPTFIEKLDFSIK